MGSFPLHPVTTLQGRTVRPALDQWVKVTRQVEEFHLRVVIIGHSGEMAFFPCRKLEWRTESVTV